MSTTNANGLLYTPCRYCLNEGLYHCRICKANYCDEHSCFHLGVIETDKLPAPTYESVLFGDANIDQDGPGFREFSDEQLKQVPEMQLRSRLQRLMSEAKRVQRELERRMIHSDYMRGIKHKATIMPQSLRDIYGVSKSTEQAEKNAEKLAAKQAKKQEQIQAALRILADAMIAEQKLNSKKVS